eukprot:5952396-Pleurochrysis_carterae.AAC.4
MNGQTCWREASGEPLEVFANQASGERVGVREAELGRLRQLAVNKERARRLRQHEQHAFRWRRAKAARSAGAV